MRLPALLSLPLSIALALLVLSGCGNSQSGAASDKPQVLTTFTVIADMAREVGGERVEVNSITKPGSEIHGYEPTPSDLKRAARADLVLAFGPATWPHRLARVSPFNAQGKRQTSFATVDVTPEFEETALEIPEKDLEISFFARSSGPGGQNVNKVASACRVVHKPTGIMIVASTYRDQPQNKKQAMSILMAKLEQLEEERREKELSEATGGAVERGWGTQIRSYVIYDNRVKDHRTGHEVGNPQTVLDGALDEFIDAELKRRRRALADSAAKPAV